MEEVKGLVFDIKRYAVHDGPGIRTTIFLKGCPATCWWCHNPESQSRDTETVLRTYQIEDQTFEETESLGRWMTPGEVWEEVKKETVFADASGGGVTVSGGEPLMQPDFLNALLKRLGANGVHRTLDTTGYATAEIFDTILPNVDLFLFDLKIIDDALHQIYTGVSNKPILRNLSKILQEKARVILRFPVIPEYTDTVKNIEAVKAFVSGLKNGVEELDLLPFHDIARAKYSRFCKPDKFSTIRKPDETRLRQIKEEFEALGFLVNIGG